MTVSELIEKLKSIQANEGDIQVVVQYRDSGGCYSGQDEDCTPLYKNGKIIL